MPAINFPFCQQTYLCAQGKKKMLYLMQKCNNESKILQDFFPNQNKWNKIKTLKGTKTKMLVWTLNNNPHVILA